MSNWAWMVISGLLGALAVLGALYFAGAFSDEKSEDKEDEVEENDEDEGDTGSEYDGPGTQLDGGLTVDTGSISI